MITLDFSRTTGQMLDIIEFDADLTIDRELPSEVTNFPVEDGSTLSDSIIRKPRTWNATHRVTDTPTKVDIQPIGTDSGARTVQVWQRLQQAWQNRQTCRYIDALDVVECVAIVNVRTSESSETQGCLDFTITYQEILTATVQRAKITLKPHGGKRKSKGVVSGLTSSGQRVVDVEGNLLGWQQANGTFTSNPDAPNVTTPPTFGSQNPDFQTTTAAPQGKTAFERKYFHRPLSQDDAGAIFKDLQDAVTN